MRTARPLLLASTLAAFGCGARTDIGLTPFALDGGFTQATSPAPGRTTSETASATAYTTGSYSCSFVPGQTCGPNGTGYAISTRTAAVTGTYTSTLTDFATSTGTALETGSSGWSAVR